MRQLDAHQHFWIYTPEEYDWIDDEMAVLRRDFLPEDLEPVLHASGFAGSIAVQARQSVGETIWLLDLARANSFIRGVVGWVELCAPTVEADLTELTRNKKLVGVRHVVQGEPDDEFVLRADFQRGIALLERFGLVYDLLLYLRHLRPATQLVHAFPGQAFVLDHMAKPFIAKQELEPWAREMRALAAAGNVACKLSGMVTEADWKGWKAEDFRPYLDVVLEAFGPERLMIGSDWPVCTVSCGHERATGIVRDYIGGLSADEQAAILGGTCARVYGVS